VAHNFNEVTIVTKKRPKATKCSNHCTISLTVHTAKIVPRILRRRTERKTKDFLGEDQFGFRRRRGTRNAIGILRIIPDKLWL
jgi:hypothetical protein